MSNVCLWIGRGEGCRHPAMWRKSYCEDHYSRIYLTIPPEMAEYIVDNEIDKNVSLNIKIKEDNEIWNE